MSQLTPCHSRRTLPLGSNESLCAHPKVVSRGQRVHAGICRLCQFGRQAPPQAMRDVPDNPGTLLRRPAIEIVVARYREDLGWLESLQHWPTTVYDKGDPQAAHALPNVGREADTYLQHIVQHYDELAEVTVFLQGNPFDHVQNLFEKIGSLDEKVQFRDLGDAILAENTRGEPYQPVLDLSKGYREHFEEEPPEFYLCHAAACFAVHRDVIHARPKTYYELLLERVRRDRLGPWWIERHWHRVFRPKKPTRGLVTAADARYFRDLQMFVRSLAANNSENSPLCVFDLGLTPGQRDWCNSQPQVLCTVFPEQTAKLQRLSQYAMWQAWLKPYYLAQAPFERVIWIDADCTVLSDIGALFESLEHRPLLFRDSTSSSVENDPRLYRFLPVDSNGSSNDRGVNSGVVGLCKWRDRELLAAWAWGVLWCAARPERQRYAAWWDQGMLTWAIKRTGKSHLIRDEPAWNLPAREFRDLLSQAIRNGGSLLDEIRRRFPDAHNVHWVGDWKLSKQLSREFDKLFVEGVS